MNMIMQLYINPWLFTLAVIVLVIILAFVILWVVRAHQRKVAAGKEDLVGRTAVVRTALNPRGMVFVEDELWTAVIDKGTAEPEEEVTISRVDGLKLMVTKK